MRSQSQNNFRNSQAIWLKVIGATEANSVTADYSMTAEYYHYAGTCYRLMGEYEKAIEYYKLVVDNWPEYEAACCVQGLIPQVYERMKSEGSISGQQADNLIVEAYQQVIDKYPDSPAADYAANRIKRYQNPRQPAQAGNMLRRTLSNQGGQQ